jgi:competence protein ComEA
MRTQMVLISMVILGALGGVAAWRWPVRPSRAEGETNTAAAAVCQHYENGPQGTVQCGPGRLSVAASLTLQQIFDLNTANETELAQIPGIGQRAAEALIAARPNSGFASWEEVDAVSGVGAARLAVLQKVSVLAGRNRDADAGL